MQQMELAASQRGTVGPPFIREETDNGFRLPGGIAGGVPVQNRQDLGKLRPGQGALGLEGPIREALEDARIGSPEDGLGGKFTDPVPIGSSPRRHIR